MITSQQAEELYAQLHVYREHLTIGKRSDKLAKLYESYGDEWVLAPASTKTDYHGCYVGGHLHHTIALIDNMIGLSERWGFVEADHQQLVFVAMNARIGKLGFPKVPLYLATQEAWQQKKGIMYEINHDILPMEIGDRSLYVLQRVGINLSAEEWLAIKLYAGPYQESNNWYLRQHGDELPNLVHLLHQADMLTTKTLPK